MSGGIAVAALAVGKSGEEFPNAWPKVNRQAENRAKLDDDGVHLPIAAAEIDPEQGFADEWGRHHQGGLTGYRGREVFATPGEPAVIPVAGAVAWNPSIAGGAKSEDTALVTAQGVEVITRTPDLGELGTSDLRRPAIVTL